MFDRETGRSKGFAFATFADEESVPIAMNASGIELDGKAVCPPCLIFQTSSLADTFL